MTEHSHDRNFGSSIVYEDRLHLKVEPYSSEPESGEVLRNGLQNEEILRMVMSLDEVMPSEKSDDRDSEIQRLEFKMNLMLDMLGEIYSKNVDFPELFPVKLGASVVSWMIGDEDFVPELESYVALHVYLNRRYPRSIVLFARVVQFNDCESGEKWVTAELLPMPMQTQDCLERFVFRQHRRFVAFSRQK